MADDRFQLHEDALVVRLQEALADRPDLRLGDPMNVLKLGGLVSQSPRGPEYWRLLSPVDMAYYVDIEKRNVIYAQQPDPLQEPSGISQVWVMVPKMTTADAFVMGILRGMNMSGRQMLPGNDTVNAVNLTATLSITGFPSNCCPTA